MKLKVNRDVRGICRGLGIINLQISRAIRFVYRRLMSRPIITILCVLALSFLLANVLIMICEKVPWGEAATMILPAFLGELGIVESSNLVTRMSCLAALVASVAFLAILTGKITSSFVEFCKTGGSIMKKVDLSDHVLICGWNVQGERIVDELLDSGDKARRGIAILARREECPVTHDRVQFVKGDPTQDEDLIRAGVKRADSIIVLSNVKKRPNLADAEALMIVLAVESLNRPAHTSVQIMNSANRVHMERAHADEIICMDQMGAHLIVSSTVNHGISSIVSELLTFNDGSELYRYDGPLPDLLVGTKFADAVQLLAKHGKILLGFETHDTPEMRKKMSKAVLHEVKRGRKMIVVNPQVDYELSQDDALFIIAEEEPAKLLEG